MKGYQYIANLFNNYGIAHIFYVESILENMLLEASNLGLMPIMTHTENAAGYMADGYARASGKPGICLAQSIGTANLAGGIYDASLANSPVIAITGKKPPYYQYKGAYQEAEHRLLFEGITKFNAEIIDSSQLGHVMRLAFKKAVTGRPGPVHIDVLNNLGIDIEFSEVNDSELPKAHLFEYPNNRQAAETETVYEAAKMIAKATRPLIVAGRGTIVSGAGKELYDLANKAGIPVATTPDGKTIIDEESSIWAGVVGAYGNQCANKIAQMSDLIIFVGTQANDQTSCNWTMPSKETPVIHIEIDPGEVGKNYKNTLGLVGDAKTVLNQLYQVIKEVKREKWLQQIQKYVNREFSEYKDLSRSYSSQISPYRLCSELSNFLPEDSVLVADTGNSAIWTSTQVRMKETQRYYRAAGSLGWSYPASLGIKCAVPEKPVICFIGDGAFYYHMAEMETAVRNGINTITVINNNGGLVQVRELLDVVYENDSQTKKEKAYRFRDVNLSLIAKEMGCFAIRVESAEEIQPALKRTLELDKPAVIEVMTSDIYPPNPMPTGPRPLYGAALARP